MVYVRASAPATTSFLDQAHDQLKCVLVCYILNESWPSTGDLTKALERKVAYIVLIAEFQESMPSSDQNPCKCILISLVLFIYGLALLLARNIAAMLCNFTNYTGD